MRIFLSKRLFRIIRARDDFRKIAELLRLEKDLAARIRAELQYLLPEDALAPLRDLHRQAAAVENPPLAGVALRERQPFLHELFRIRLARIDRRIVRHRALRVGEIELSGLCRLHLRVIKVGKRDHRAAAHAARHDHLADLAADVMHVDIGKPTSLLGQDLRARERKERAQRLRAGALAAHRLQARAGGAELRKIKLDVLAVEPRAASRA